MIAALYHDALVAGGGPAGSTLAIALALAGKRTVLIERTREAQHKVCGEFLSPESLPILHGIGVDPEALGAHVIHSLRIVGSEILAELALPAKGLSLTRRTLDEALLERAKQAGVNLLRGYNVEELVSVSAWDATNMWQARISNSKQKSLCLHGRDAFLATGKHDLRGYKRNPKGTHDSLVAMKAYFALSPQQQAELAGSVELVFFSGGYAGLQLVEGGVANLCVLVKRGKLQSLGAHWDCLLAHMQESSKHLRRRLNGAKPLLERSLALSGIPYGFCVGNSIHEPSPWRVGDQAAVIPSFLGDGMAIALHSAARASQLYLRGANAADFHQEVRKQLRNRLYLASKLSRLLVTMPSVAQAVRLWPAVLSEIFAATRVPGPETDAVWR